MAEEQERCLAAGMLAHLTKPIDPDALLSTILAHVATQPTVPLDSTAPTKPSAAASAFGVSSIIDRDKLLARYHHRQSFIDKLLATILSSHTDSPVKLREAAANGDVETIRFIAHALKGIGGSIESAPLIVQAVATESSAKAGAADAIQQALLLADLTDSVLALLGEPLATA
jgi:HPt (histidine-containing phosphotransfer) domain-containing protein